MQKKNKHPGYLFLAASLICGVILISYLFGEGESNAGFQFLLGIIFGTLAGFVVKFFQSLWKLKNSNKQLSMNEKSVVAMRRYLMIVLYLVLIVSTALLLFLYGLGIETIETRVIIIYVGLIYVLIIVGATLTKGK
ncbi:hypothetical protein [Radiobacillus sp. PE A8.2]|uniref:hypothetical protein n=1 Tax=Radiobacillus sp. PE A8.2 TaxID=3380349 RepID=UPI00388D6D30